MLLSIVALAAALATSPALPANDGRAGQILPPVSFSDMTVDGRVYSVFTMRPPRPAPAGGYGLLVVLDGNANFATAAASAWSRSAFADIAPLMVVGIGYPTTDSREFLSRRVFDFTSSAANQTSPELKGLPQGGAEAFRQGVVAAVLEKMEREEQVNPKCRVLLGHSLGGLFVVDTMFRHPDMFEGYFAGSPALHANNFEIFDRVPSKEQMAKMLATPVRLRLEVGEREARISERQLQAFPAFRTAPDAKMVASVQRLSEMLAERASPNLSVTTKILEGESHLSLVPGMIGEAITFASECASGGVQAPILSEDAFRAHVSTLASDAFEGRGPGTAGEVRTVEYISETFKAAGLQPGGDRSREGERSWTQQVPLRRSKIIGTSAVTLATGAGSVVWQQGEQIAIRAPLTGDQRIKVDHAPVIFAGYGVSAPERNWDDYKNTDLKGKIVVVLVNDPDVETGQGAFGGKTMTWYGRSVYKYQEAAKRGALGVLIVHEDAAVGGYGWATTRNSNTNEVFDIDGPHLRNEHSPLEGWIQVAAAEDLVRRAGLDFATLKAAARTPGFTPVPLKGVTLSTDLRVSTSVVKSHNVIGYLPGSSRPNEYVIYIAHWDAHGVGEYPDAKGERIYHGARDNASGTAMLLELSRYFASQPRPARSVVFVGVTAEEKGMLGSKYYSMAPTFPLEQTAAAINMDGVLGAGRARSVSTLGDSQNALQDELGRLASQSGRYLEPDSTPQAGYFTRSDQFWFAKQGVPALGFSPGSDLLAGGLPVGLAAKRAYATNQYHQPADKYEPSIDFGNMPEDAMLLARLGGAIAATSDWPEWHATSEFKPVRDRTLGSRAPKPQNDK